MFLDPSLFLICFRWKVDGQAFFWAKRPDARRSAFCLGSFEHTAVSGFGARDAESPRQNPRTSSLPLRLTTSRAPVPRYRYRATAIRAAAAYSRIHFHIADITDRDIPSRTSHFARESTLVQASDLAGCCESHCDNHDASHTRGALRSSIVALATLSNQRFACLRSLGMALKPLAYESPRLKHAH